MKRTALIILLASITMLATFINTGCGSSEAVTYNNELVEHQNKIIRRMINFSKLAQKGDAVATSMELTEIEELIGTVIEDVEAMPGFEGDNTMRDVMVELLEFYKYAAAKDLREIIEVIRGRTTFLQSDREYIQNLLNDIDDAERELDQKLKKTQREFARKHNVTIKENPLQKRLYK